MSKRKRLGQWMLAVGCMAAVSTTLSSITQTHHRTTKIGAPTYWGTEQSWYNQLPPTALAVINPSSGILATIDGVQTTTPVPNLPAFTAIVNEQYSRGVKMLGYVPTGYFGHDCPTSVAGCQTWDRITAQVREYFQNTPNLRGIFFDEASSTSDDCNLWIEEYRHLRAIVRQHDDNARPAWITFNSGTANPCMIEALEQGDIAVLFEGTAQNYADNAQSIIAATSAAHARGVVVWHLVHTARGPVELENAAQEAKDRKADLVYITDVGGDWLAGDKTWNSVPAFWARERELFAGGENHGTVTGRIRNAGSRLCLRGRAGFVEQRNSAGTIGPFGFPWFNPRWTLVPRTVSGQHYYQMQFAGKCLTMPLNRGDRRVTLSGCALGDRQLFAMNEMDGTQYFTSKVNEHALTVSRAFGAQLVVQPYDDADAQKFSFLR